MKKICAKLLIMALVLQSVYLTVNVTNESAKAATLNLHNPTMINGVSTWDCVYFGTYWQNDTNGDGIADQNDAKEPIKWRVLQVDGDDVFLMSDKNLDCQKYNNNEVDVTWETCSLRTWLYSNFYRKAFSTEEQNVIKVTTVVNDKNEVYGTSGGNTTKDKIYIHIEFQARFPTKKELQRIFAYVALLHEYTGCFVETYIICVQAIPNDQIIHQYSKDNVFKINIMSLKNIDGNKKINSISKKNRKQRKTNTNRNTCFEINAVYKL